MPTAHEELMEKLQAGTLNFQNIPQIYLENERIVSPDSAEGQTFQRHMERITKRLLPSWPLDKKPILFLITDKGEPNASVLEGNNVTLMEFDKSILRYFQNEDELAYVLGHEFTHMELSQELGRGPNSKGEEFIADIRPLVWIHTAGYDAKAALEFTKRNTDEYAKHRIDWFTFADKHGLPKHREDAVRTSIAGIDKHYGGLHHEPSAMPIDLTEAITNARHVSYFDKIRQEANFDTLPPVEQLNVVVEHIPEITTEHTARIEEGKTLLRGMKLSHTNAAHVQAVDQVIDGILPHADRYRLFYRSLVAKRSNEQQNSKDTDPPGGMLAQVAECAQAFKDAETPEEMEKPATHMVDVASKVPTSVPFHQITIPRFSLPSRDRLESLVKRGPYAPSWRHHVEAALQSKSPIIAEALVLMGIPDERIFARCPDDFLKAVSSRQIKPVSYAHLQGESGTSVKVDSKGEIIDIADFWEAHEMATNVLAARINPQALAEKNQKQTLKASATAPLPQVFTAMPAEEFLTNYEAVFDTYQANLEMTTELKHRISREDEPGGNDTNKYVVANDYRLFQRNSELVVRKIEALLDQDRERHKDFVRGFFLGRPDGKDLRQLTGWNFDFANAYSKFVTEDKYHLFSIEEKGVILTGSELPDIRSGITTSSETLAKVSARDEDDFDPGEGGGYAERSEALHWWRNTLRYAEPTTIDELVAALDKYQKFLKGGESVLRTSAENIPEEMGQEEVADFVKDYCKTPGRVSLLPLLETHGNFLPDRTAANRKFYSLLTASIEKEKNWPDDPNRLIHIYKNLEDVQLFPNEDWRAKFVARITKSIEKLGTSEEKIHAIETLLFGQPVKDVDLRTRAVAQWVDENTKVFGKDAGTAEYHAQFDDAFQKMVQRVKSGAIIQQRYELFTVLADALETQKQWSYLLRDNLIEKSRQHLVDSHKSGVISEFVLNQISKTPELRKETIEFLVSPLTKKSVDTYAVSFGKVLESRFHLYTEDDDEYDEFDDGDEDNQSHGPRITDGIKIIEAKRFHENFWNAPVPVRMVLIDQLLMNNEERRKDRSEGTKNYDEAFKYVSDLVLPKGMKYAEEARTFLEAYSKVVPEYQRTLLLSAMMTAGERASYEGKDVSIGRRLAMILELMGPAERKVGQAVHSHPDTPEDIRVDMARMKSMAAVPTRWDLITRYEEAVPEEYRDTVARIGTLKGSASYFMTVGLEKKDGSHSVMALQRENALPQAKEGFRLLYGLIEELKVKDAKINTIADTLVEMVQQAEKMSDIETNADIGAQQVETAQRLYNGVKVNIGKQVFSFETAPWITYGPEFRDQVEMPGTHFNDLPEKTPKQKQYKHDVAKASIAVEFLNILKGGAFDHDRHGAQLRIDTKTNHIGLFDHGAMELQPPTDHEKEQLAEALFQGIAAYQHGKPITEVLFDEIHRMRQETGHTADYLVRVERAMLAMTDFFRYITPADVPDIVMGVYNMGQIDPVIQNTIGKMISRGDLDFSSFVTQSNQPIQVTQETVVLPPPPKRYAVDVKPDAVVAVAPTTRVNGANGTDKPENKRKGKGRKKAFVPVDVTSEGEAWTARVPKQRAANPPRPPKNFEEGGEREDRAR